MVRYFFNGITLAPEIFQKVISQILEGLKEVVCQTDDILVSGARSRSKTDGGFRYILQAEGVMLNKEICHFAHEVNRDSVRGWGVGVPCSTPICRHFRGQASVLGRYLSLRQRLVQHFKDVRLCVR